MQTGITEEGAAGKEKCYAAPPTPTLKINSSDPRNSPATPAAVVSKSTGSKGGHVIPIALRTQIERVIFELRLGDTARRYIWASIEGGPSRTVQGAGGNVVVNFHSHKMGLRLLLESRHGEHASAILLERDKDVLAYFAQPPQVSLDLLREDGSHSGRTNYTPDMLIIMHDRIVVRETRDHSRLVRAHMKSPHQFYSDEQGRWHYAAAEQFFQGMGLQYEIISNQSLPSMLVENARFLEDYLSDVCPPLDTVRGDYLRKILSERRCCSLYDLLGLGFTADEVYQGIAEGVAYVDINTDRLSASSDLQIFSDQATHHATGLLRSANMEAPLPIPGTLDLRPGVQLKFQGTVFQVLFVSHDEVVLQDEQGRRNTYKLSDIQGMHAERLLSGGEATRSPVGRQIADISPAALKRASERLEALRTGASTSYSARSISRFRERTEHTVNELEKLLALVDDVELRGNRNRRISEANTELIESAISQFYNQPEIRGYKAVWDKYCGMCNGKLEANGQPMRPVGYPSFTRYAAKLRDEKARRGKRAAYQIDPIYASVNGALPVHGVRPHEVCYVDHTIANIALVSPSGIDLGKPTLTLAIDGCTAHPRAQVLTFDPPSTKTVLLLMRDYVRRHHRLPRILSVDNGKEFHSKELELFCTVYGIELRYRPPARARGGSMIERLMGASEEEVLGDLVGNTRIMKTDTRLVTKSVNPFNRAEWTLVSLHGRLEIYLFDERPNRPHPALGMSPNAFEAQRILETGERPFRCVHFDQNLLLMSSPHPKMSHHRVDRQRGVWVGGIWYNHPALKSLPPRTKVEIRIEPWHASVVYVQVSKGWVVAVGNCPRWLAGRTSREVEIMLREERRRATQTAGKASVTADKRSSRQRLWTPQDFDPRLAEQQREARHLYETLGMTVALPEVSEIVQEASVAKPVAADTAFPPSPTPANTTPPNALPVAPVSTSNANAVEYPVVNKASNLIQRTGRFH